MMMNDAEVHIVLGNVLFSPYGLQTCKRGQSGFFWLLTVTVARIKHLSTRVPLFNLGRVV